MCLIISPILFLGILLYFWNQLPVSAAADRAALFPHILWAAVFLCFLMMAGVGFILWQREKNRQLTANQALVKGLFGDLSYVPNSDIFDEMPNSLHYLFSRYGIEFMRVLTGREKPARKPAKNSDDSNYL